jgi:hypothetical protein
MMDITARMAKTILTTTVAPINMDTRPLCAGIDMKAILVIYACSDAHRMDHHLLDLTRCNRF